MSEFLSAYGETPVAVFYDRHLVECWAGPEGEDVLAGRDPVERAAVHEASHIVAAWRFDLGIDEVFIRRAGESGSRGLAVFGPIGVTTAAIGEFRQAIRELRQTIREEPTSTETPIARPHPRYISDVRRAVRYARLLRAGRKAVHELVRVRRFEARMLVNRDAVLIRAVAAELLKAGRLSGVEVEAILSRTMATARAQRLQELGV